MSSVKRTSAIILLFLAFAASVVAGVLSSVAPLPAPQGVLPGPALAPRLSERVLLVIVDGLRYDVATDRAKMPHFAAAMQKFASGEIWAGRVSMTSSAVLSLGTGQRGRLEQIIRNLSAEPAHHNSWLENAHKDGLKLAVAGDPAWSQLYGNYLTEQRLDPEGVAIDVDFNPQTFRNVRQLARAGPDFLVAHFVTPDHQGHAHGIRSPRYTAHIHEFDRQLAELLEELDDSWTVLVTSDHGAADSGTHGADAPVLRRCPIYAYGPGISPPTGAKRRLEQVDLSATLAVLLGVAPPAHGVGRVLVEWLNVAPSARSLIACAQAQRVLHYVGSLTSNAAKAERMLLPCSDFDDDLSKLSAVERSVRAADEVATTVTGLASARTSWSAFAIVVLGVAIVILLSPRRDIGLFAAGATLVAFTVLLVVVVEKLPGVWPNVTRGAIFLAGNLVLLALWIRPRAISELFERSLPYSALVAPGLLVITYPSDARPQSVAVLAVLAILYGTSRLPAGPTLAAAARSRSSAFALALAVAALLPVAFWENATYSALIHDETLRRVAVSLAVVVWLVWFNEELSIKHGSLLLLIALAVLPTWLRSMVAPDLGRGVWLVLTFAFVLLLIQGLVAWAVTFSLLSLLWISRDFEAVPLFAAVTIAWIAGRRLAEARPNLSNADLLFAVVLGFSLLFALRIGIQDGLEFDGLDWGAGAFNDADVSFPLVAGTLVFKYAVAAMLVGLALTHSLTHEHKNALLSALTLCLIVRTLALFAMFFIAGQSYWTGLRVLGDLPTAIAMGLGGLLSCLAMTVRSAHSAPSSEQSISLSDPSS